jgi:hypothetical protein
MAPATRSKWRRVKGERKEDADCIQRDQRASVPAERDEHERRHDRQEGDPIVEGKAIAHLQERPGGEAVSCEQEHYAREVVVRGIGCQQEHQRSRRLRIDVERAASEVEVREL